MCVRFLTSSFTFSQRLQAFPLPLKRALGRARFLSSLSRIIFNPALISNPCVALSVTHNERYNVESLLTRYRGVDWRQKRDLLCNGGMNPQGEQMNDGLGLDPFEVVFVKAKEYPRVATQVFLNRYTEYAMGRDDLTSNGFDTPRVQVAIQKERVALQERVLRCQASFDADFYLKQNPDLPGAVPRADALKHFNEYGFFERRPYRYKSHWRKARDPDCLFE